MDKEPLMLDVSQAHELKLAFRRSGWTNADIKRLCEGETLACLLAVIRGLAEIVPIAHLINCDVQPSEPSGLKVHEHTKGGMLKWDPARVTLYLFPDQKSGRMIKGTKLQEELRGKPVLSANVLDYLLANQHLIPEDWKGNAVFFWGTIYRGSDGGLFVRCLYWSDAEWYSGCDWLKNDWNDAGPAALLASPVETPLRHGHPLARRGAVLGLLSGRER